MSVAIEALLAAVSTTVGRATMTDQEVGETFRKVAASLVGFDHVVVFAYRGGERPIDLYHTFDAREHVIYVSMYQDGPYLLDPFYGAVREGRSGLLRMRELAPDRFFSSEYYRSYYVQTGLAEEVGFFIPAGDCTVVLSLMRREGTGVFPATQFARIKTAEPFVSALVKAYWGNLGPRFDAQHKEHKRGGRGERKLQPADRVWEALNLTAREAAIVELVLQGHSSESIGLRLKISTGTVKVHRRNVYRKLGISSQTQLLALYMNSLASPPRGSGGAR